MVLTPLEIQVVNRSEDELSQKEVANVSVANTLCQHAFTEGHVDSQIFAIS